MNNALKKCEVGSVLNVLFPLPFPLTPNLGPLKTSNFHLGMTLSDVLIRSSSEKTNHFKYITHFHLGRTLCDVLIRSSSEKTNQFEKGLGKANVFVSDICTHL